MKRRLWPWFVAGFLATFVGIALLKSVYVMVPSGEAVARVKLWRYYLHEWPKTFAVRTWTLGPETVNHDALLPLTISHIAVSVVVGAVVMAVIWGLSRGSCKTVKPVADMDSKVSS